MSLAARRQALARQVRWRVGIPLRRAIPEPVKPVLRGVAGVLDPIRLALWRRANRYPHRIPPRALRSEVGAMGVARYVRLGEQSVADVIRAAQAAETDILGQEHVLDFGCGPGRVLVPMRDARRGRPGLAGSDVNRPAIEWLQRRGPSGIEGVVNDFEPPLPFEDGRFDAVYSLSILTHLPLELQDAWLAELRRITRPGGLLMVTVHGESAYETFRAGEMFGASAKLIARLRSHGPLAEEGFVFEPYEPRENEAPGLVSDSYGLSFQTPAQVRERWGRDFEVADVLARASLHWQDVVVMRRPAT